MAIRPTASDAWRATYGKEKYLNPGAELVRRVNLKCKEQIFIYTAHLATRAALVVVKNDFELSEGAVFDSYQLKGVCCDKIVAVSADEPL